ncbi:6480_t:CDS:2 [Funneliformis geosporum]|nr:6480_t:CDS:2 [Funneliformis geosporum]
MKNLINSILRFLLPKDRETRKLGEIAKFQYGYTATASEQGEFRYIRITDIDEFGNISDKEKKYVDLPTDINQEKYLLKKNDVLVTRTGSYEQANNLVGGTAQPQFNANSLKKIMVPILGVKEQKKIVIKLDEEAETFLTTFYSYRLSSNVIKKILDLY